MFSFVNSYFSRICLVLLNNYAYIYQNAVWETLPCSPQIIFRIAYFSQSQSYLPGTEDTIIKKAVPPGQDSPLHSGVADPFNCRPTDPFKIVQTKQLGKEKYLSLFGLSWHPYLWGQWDVRVTAVSDSWKFTKSIHFVRVWYYFLQDCM